MVANSAAHWTLETPTAGPHAPFPGGVWPCKVLIECYKAGSSQRGRQEEKMEGEEEGPGGRKNGRGYC